jgi:hypothetical protein
VLKEMGQDVSNYKLHVQVIQEQVILLDVLIYQQHHFALLILVILHVLLLQLQLLVKLSILVLEITIIQIVINSKLDVLTIQPPAVPLKHVLIIMDHPRLLIQPVTLG